VFDRLRQRTEIPLRHRRRTAMPTWSVPITAVAR
jgi:hypothetical protein